MASPNILQPGEIEVSAPTIPQLLMPPAGVYRERAQRLRTLAQAHSLAGYLEFAAALSEQQDRHAGLLGDVKPIDDTLVNHCREHGIPPLSVSGWARDPAWRRAVIAIAQDLMTGMSGEGREVMQGIVDGRSDWIESQADALLALDMERLDLGAAPVIGAALQMYWRHLASTLDAGQIGRGEFQNLCPVCGSHPVASVIRIGGAENGLRYLVCSLCSSQWYLERVKCSNCGNPREIGYHAVENAQSAIRAESCPDCHSYLKIFYLDKDHALDPVADDLASIQLDWLMSDAGYARSGVNHLMLQKAADET